jgi:exonuclease SbcC
MPPDAPAIVARWTTALREARAAEERTRQALDRAGNDQDGVREARRGLESELASLREGCATERARLAGVPDLPLVDRRPSEPQPFADEIAALAASARAGCAALEEWRKGKEAERTCRIGALEKAAAKTGLVAASGKPDETRSGVAKAAADAQRAADRAHDKRDGLTGKLARRREHEAEVAESRKRESLYRALADELRRDRFIDYILAESVRRLAATASQQLRTISGNRYSLAAGKTGFEVIDHANADERRSVATLSGGETFLASLSLAMALAGSITDIAGEAIGSRLEAMFIDEGFGTLDAETLDTVIDALESLRDTGRLVGVITHLGQLADRIPDGLEVRREGTSSHVRLRQ